MSNHALLFFGFFFGIVLTAIVAVDAHGRGRSGFIWGLLTFFTGLLGAFVYALVVLTGDGADDDEPESLRTCPACGEAHPGDPDYCSNCGEALDKDDETVSASILRSGSQGYCGNCKASVPLDAESCPECNAVF